MEKFTWWRSKWDFLQTTWGLWGKLLLGHNENSKWNPAFVVIKVSGDLVCLPSVFECNREILFTTADELWRKWSPGPERYLSSKQPPKSLKWLHSVIKGAAVEQAITT